MLLLYSEIQAKNMKINNKSINSEVPIRFIIDFMILYIEYYCNSQLFWTKAMVMYGNKSIEVRNNIFCQFPHNYDFFRRTSLIISKIIAF